MSAGKDVEVKAQGRTNADCNDDNTVNGEDLRLLLQFLAGTLKEL